MPITRALPLYQPWATLVVIGAKQWETRSKRCLIRERVAIYATLKWSNDFSFLIQNEPFKRVLGQRGIINHFGLLRGYIVGTAEITDCISTTEWIRRFCRREAKHEQEYQFGDYRPGRYAWKLENPRPLKTPIQARGWQGFFNLEPETAAQIEAQLAA